MSAGPDNELLASPRDFFPGRKRRVAELFAELFGRSFLPFPHFAAVDHHIMRVALSPDLDLAKFDQSCFHNLNVPLPRAPGQETGILRLRYSLGTARVASPRFSSSRRCLVGRGVDLISDVLPFGAL